MGGGAKYTSLVETKYCMYGFVNVDILFHSSKRQMRLELVGHISFPSTGFFPILKPNGQLGLKLINSLWLSQVVVFGDM